MSISNLTGEHIGREVTVTADWGTISGRLWFVQHAADRVDVKGLDGVPAFLPGRFWTEVQVGPARWRQDRPAWVVLR